ARRVSRPLVYEPKGGASPEIIFPHESMQGIERNLPPISGFVLTQTKDSPLAQVIIQSPKPDAPENATIAAAWTYGLGRSAVITTDGGARWAANWTSWDGYEKLYSQLVRWLMRPSGENSQFSISSSIRDDQVHVVVTALTKDDEYLNFLDIQATAIDPDLNPIPLRLRQSAPGRYVGTFPIAKTGSYFVNVIPGTGNAPLSTGISVPYSAEYRIRESNLELMNSLAEQTPSGGEAGQIFSALESDIPDTLVNENPFRSGLAPARSIQDAWHWFVLVACFVLLADVFVRRVTIPFGWLTKLLPKRENSEIDRTQENRISALREKKAAVSKEMRSRVETSLELGDKESPDGGGESQSSTSVIEKKETFRPKLADSPDPQKGISEPNQSDSSDYTQRLLEAKRRAKK
ncbi:MAG: glutamine amidotransferase, partial [Planctomycetota bacterium]|nr:glutamine amidotransferase [Planctomycetota bacterium]